jgi:HSP20 family protein
MDAPLARMFEPFDQLVDSIVADFATPRALRGFTASSFPALNMWEHGDRIIVDAELPGFSMDDIEVSVVDDALTIKGTRRVDAPTGATSLRRERGSGQFTRSVSLPVPIHADSVEARLSDGVLTITLPKAEAAKPRKIDIRQGNCS